MHLLRTLSISALAALVALIITVPVAAQTPAISFTPNALGAEDFASDTGQNSYNLGYEFTSNSAINITSIGYFFDPTVGFTQDHQVGIYDLSGNLLGSATVSQNTANDTANGFFMYTALPSGGITLTPGSYIVAGVTGPTDPYLFNVLDYTDPSNPGNGLVTPSEISFVQDEFAVGGDLSAIPTSTDGLPGSYFGPNFLFTSNGAAVPEPSPAATLLTALALLAAFAVRWKLVRRKVDNA